MESPLEQQCLQWGFLYQEGNLYGTNCSVANDVES